MHGEEGTFPLQFVAEVVEGVSFFFERRFPRRERFFDVEQLLLLFRDEGKVVMGVSVRNEAVDDRARIFPFGEIVFGELFSFFRKPEIFAPAAVGKVPVIRFDVFEGFEAFERAVKGGLFQRVQPAALLFDLVDDVVAVLVAVVQASQDDRVDVPADEIGTDGGDALFFRSARQGEIFEFIDFLLLVLHRSFLLFRIFRRALICVRHNMKCLLEYRRYFTYSIIQ